MKGPTPRAILAVAVSVGLALGAVVVLVPGGPPGSPVSREPPGPIRHVVEIMLENHAFDNFFGTYPGANGPPNGTALPNGQGGTAAPYWISGDSTPDLPHERPAELADLDGGRMDGFVEQMALVNPSAAATPMGYYNETQLAAFWALAGEFVLCDTYFASVLGPTVPNRLYAMAGASAGITTDVLPQNTELYTIFDQLSAYGFSWDYFAEAGTYPMLPSFLLPLSASPSELANLRPLSQLAGTIASGGLPAVTFVDPEGSIYSQHPPLSVTAGEAWTMGVIDAIETSPVWNSTVVFLTWDEGGGYYDHVAPPVMDSLGDGFRVPMLVVSPFSVGGGVDATVFDHTSVLKFIEQAWGLPILNDRVNETNNLCSTLVGLPASQRCAAFGPPLLPDRTSVAPHGVASALSAPALSAVRATVLALPRDGRGLSRPGREGPSALTERARA